MKRVLLFPFIIDNINPHSLELNDIDFGGRVHSQFHYNDETINQVIYRE